MGENVHVGEGAWPAAGRGNLCRSRRQRVVFRPGQFQHSPGPVLSFHLQDCAGPIRRRQHPNHRSAVHAVGKVIFRRKSVLGEWLLVSSGIASFLLGILLVAIALATPISIAYWLGAMPLCLAPC